MMQSTAVVSGGAKANTNGKLLEKVVEQTAVAKGFQPVDQKKYIPEEWAGKRILIRNGKFDSIYNASGKSRAKSEYVLQDETGEKIRVECKWQQRRGTTDEKFPFLFLNALNSPEKRVIILVDGGGAREGAVQWLKDACKNPAFNIPQDKKIDVMNMSEFMRWMNGAF